MEKTYNEKVHGWGRIWMVSALAMMVLVPLVISVVIGVWPDPGKFLQAFFGIAVIYWTVTTIEVFTYAPMLGSGGTYLGFVTGNLTSLKVPSALNAMNALDIKSGSEQGDVVSTIAIAASSIITTIIIFIGAMLLIPFETILDSPALTPAFGNIIPALFGALGVVYISRNWKIAIVPVLFMIILFSVVPSLASSVGILVPVGCLIAIFAARILYKKGAL